MEKVFFFKGIVKDAFSMIWQFPLVKAFVSLLLMIIGFVIPHEVLWFPGVGSIVVLMFIDTITGIMASIREGKSITSRRAVYKVYQLGVYFLVLLAGFHVDKTLPWSIAEPSVVAFVGMTEFISILENVGRLGFEVPQKLLNQFYKNRKQY